jgi:hypothetical protein
MPEFPHPLQAVAIAPGKVGRQTTAKPQNEPASAPTCLASSQMTAKHPEVSRPGPPHGRIRQWDACASREHFLVPRGSRLGGRR